MKLKNNKGFSLIDSAIALVLLLIFIPTLGGIIYSIKKTDNSIIRKSHAVDTATDIIEMAKSVEYDKITLTDANDITDEFMDKIRVRYKNPIIREIEPNNEIEFSIEDSNKTVYKVNVKIENYVDTQEFAEKHSLEEPKDLIKKIIVKVEYPVGNNVKAIDIGSILKKY